MFDIAYELDFEQLLVSTQLTADKTNMESVDLGSVGIDAGAPGGLLFLVSIDAIATADATNFWTFEVFHADARASSTSLTSGVQVTTTTGLLNADPIVNATTLTTQAQKLIVIPYVGIKQFVQLQIDETLTADITLSVIAVCGRLDSQHGAKLG